MKNLIVSSSDQKYSHLLVELYKSLGSILGYCDFAILDCGLERHTIEFFNKNNVQIKKPRWEFQIPSYKIRGREFLKVQFSRFFMENYFPGYDNYIWLDSDTWINCKDSFDLYIQGSNKSGFAITPQVDRSYKKLIDIRWFLNFPKKINSINYKNITKSISTKLGKKYAGYATLNAGCFSYNVNFDGMKKLRNNLDKSSKKGRVFGSDQVALALTLYEDEVKFELLPAYCNWLCETIFPKFSKKINKFVEPFIPNSPIAIMHLAGLDEDRKIEKNYHEIETLEGETIRKTLRFE